MSDEINYFMKRPCQHCPFRSDVKPFLTMERGEELAFATENPYNTFYCHKTTETVEYEDGESDCVGVESSLICAGFLTMQVASEGEDFCPDGFEPAWDVVYADSYEMLGAYESQ